MLNNRWGIPAIDEARDLIGLLAAEALRLRKALDDVDRGLEEVALRNDETRAICAVVGKVTSC